MLLRKTVCLLVLAIGAGSSFILPAAALDIRPRPLPVAVIGRDDRQPISQNWRQLGLTEATLAQVMACTGIVTCAARLPALRPGECPKDSFLNSHGECFRYARASAGLVCPSGVPLENGRCAPRYLVSAAHSFVDGQGSSHVPYQACFFENYNKQRSWISGDELATVPTSFASSITLRGATPIPTEEEMRRMADDRTVMRLTTPVEGCEPFAVGEPSLLPEANADVLVVGKARLDFSSGHGDDVEPLASKCKIRSKRTTGRDSATILFSNCDIEQGSSGGFTFRLSNSAALVVGIVIGSFRSPLSIDPFTTIHVGMDGLRVPSVPRPAGGQQRP